MLGVIDYGASNIGSVENCLKRGGVAYVRSDDPVRLADCERILFPGVGNAAYAMERLRALKLDRFLQDAKVPVMGICLGMQLLGVSSEEEDTECLGIVPAPNVKFDARAVQRVPHMGWNTLSMDGSSFDGRYFYFVHSYYMPVGAHTVGHTTYAEQAFSAVIRHKNYSGTQFHPEKSGADGEALLLQMLKDNQNA